MTRDSTGKGSLGSARPVRGRVTLALAILLLLLVPLLPRALAEGDAAALIGVPGESILVLAVLCLLPLRLPRAVVATG